MTFPAQTIPGPRDDDGTSAEGLKIYLIPIVRNISQ